MKNAGVCRRPGVVWRRTLLLGAIAFGAAGCLQKGTPLVAERSPVLSGQSQREYVVQHDDTLYSIAWRYELDYRGLAAANGIRAPYTIYTGQRLQLTTQLPASQRVRQPSTNKPQSTAEPLRRSSTTSQTTAARLRWVWPLDLAPSAEFGAGSRGLDFRVESAAATVRAAAAGEVVYAGTGIGGYERLVIIKHSGALLSAYSFDGDMRVRERQRVGTGKVLAQIRRRGPAQQSLHFELRRGGKPIDPRTMLPRR